MRVGMAAGRRSCFCPGGVPDRRHRLDGMIPETALGREVARGKFGSCGLPLIPTNGPPIPVSMSSRHPGCCGSSPISYSSVRGAAIRRVPIWDCGFERITPRMHITANAFAMPIRRIFRFSLPIREEVGQFSRRHHEVMRSASLPPRIRDRFWTWLYTPLGMLPSVSRIGREPPAGEDSGLSLTLCNPDRAFGVFGMIIFLRLFQEPFSSLCFSWRPRPLRAGSKRSSALQGRTYPGILQPYRDIVRLFSRKWYWQRTPPGYSAAPPISFRVTVLAGGSSR